MSIKRHPTTPGAWIIRWRTGGRKGQQHYLTVYDCDEAEARHIEQQLRQKHGAIHNAVNPQLRHVFPEWLGWMKLHRSPKTVESICWALKHLEPHFGLLTVPMITEKIVNAYKERRRTTPRSCNLELDYLKSCISWMVERGLCQPLPFRIQRLPYQEPIPRIPTPADLQKWLISMEGDGPWDPVEKRRRPGPKNALIWIMVRAGLRFSEATQLRWENIDWQQRLIYYDSKGTAGRGRKKRVSVLPDEAHAILDPLKKESGLVAPSDKSDPDDPQPYGNMKSLFRTASRRSGVHIKGPHTLRHICATYTLAATGDLRLTQATLGHTQIRTTERYTHIDIERLRQGQRAATHMAEQTEKKT